MKRLNVLVSLVLPVLSTFCGLSGAIAQSDLEPPSILVARPARGEHLSSSEVLVEGSVSDAGSGVAALLVNGTAVTPDPVTGGFSVRVPLDFGANLITVEALDGAGNAARVSASVMSSPAYLPAGALVPNAAATRWNEPALQTLGAQTTPKVGQWITESLVGQTLFRDKEEIFGRCVASALVVAESVTFDPLRLIVDALPTGVQTRLHVPNLRIGATARSYCGVSYSTSGTISADDVVIDVGLGLGIDALRAFDVAITNSGVSLVGFGFNFSGIPGELEDLARATVRDAVRSRVADAVRTVVPSAIHQALSGLSQPIVREMNGRTVTLAALPASLAFDDGGFTAAFDGDVTAAPDPTIPAAPGSIFRPRSALPAYPNTAGFYTSLNENLINGALFGGWQAGFWNLTIDQAFLTESGLSLPFPLDGRLLTFFFPALEPMIPAGQAVPLALKFVPRLPPVVRVSDNLPLLRLGLGELDAVVMLDFGAGFVPVLAMATHFEAAIDPVFVDGVGVPVVWGERLAADLIEAPVLVAREEVDRFVQFVFTSVVQLALAAIGPMPLPALPGLTVSDLRLYPDGQAHEFVTLEGHVH
jgi:hypothetical protein